jgi:hypothetical protein
VEVIQAGLGLGLGQARDGDVVGHDRYRPG